MNHMKSFEWDENGELNIIPDVGDTLHLDRGNMERLLRSALSMIYMARKKDRDNFLSDYPYPTDGGLRECVECGKIHGSEGCNENN